jgi:hypothetical protein
MRKWIVRATGLVGAGVLALSLSACTVPEYGQMAIGVGPGKELVAYLVMCSHHIDGASVYYDNSHGQATVGNWVVSPAATGVSAFPLVKGGNGWKATMKFGPLLPGEVYDMYGWTDDSSAQAPGSSFTAKQLSTLKPWQVWSTGPGGKDQPVSLNYFATHACDYVSLP